MYIYHVTPANGAVDDTIDLAGVPNGYSVGDYGDSDELIHTGDNSNNPIVYTPRNRLVMGHNDFGSDRLSVPSGPISSNFNVYLRRNTTTDMVTATVQGTNTSVVGVYIYGSPTLEVDAPSDSQKAGMDNPGKLGEVIRNIFTGYGKRWQR